MNQMLDRNEARVLGALIEKEITTPDYYPLSLNALVNACNQKSNRDPVMELDESAVRSALSALAEKGFALSAVTEGRVAKYEHQLQELFNFSRQETALLCELLLRGQQTPGELRVRASRMQPFDELAQIHSTLEKLLRRQPPLVLLLPRQPGTKEARYAELLSSELPTPPPVDLPRAEISAPAPASVPTPAFIPAPAPAFLPAAPAAAQFAAAPSGPLAQLEEEVAALRAEVAELRRELHDLRQSHDQSR